MKGFISTKKHGGYIENTNTEAMYRIFPFLYAYKILANIVTDIYLNCNIFYEII